MGILERQCLLFLTILLTLSISGLVGAQPNSTESTTSSGNSDNSTNAQNTGTTNENITTVNPSLNVDNTTQIPDNSTQNVDNTTQTVDNATSTSNASAVPTSDLINTTTVLPTVTNSTDDSNVTTDGITGATNETTVAISDNTSTTPITTTTTLNSTTEIDYCINKTCQHGNCSNSPNNSSYLCSCDPGWNGTNCDMEIDYCVNNPCQHGNCSNSLNNSSHLCSCDPGWNGTNCDEEIDYCISKPCVHGNCSKSPNNTSHMCSCEPGWTGTNCESDISACSSNPCVHGSCSRIVGSYKCYCHKGWTGDACDTDVNECSNPGDLCGSNSDCINTNGTYECKCKDGFIKNGNNCEKQVLWPEYAKNALGIGLTGNNVIYKSTLDIPLSYFKQSSTIINVYGMGFLSFASQIQMLKSSSITNWPFAPNLFAIYWPDSAFKDTNESHLYIVESKERLQNVTIENPLISYVKNVVNQSDFEPLVAVSATWENLMTQPSYNNEKATFQLIIATDSQFTYAIKNYQTVFSNTEYYGLPNFVYDYTGSAGSRVAGMKPGNATSEVVKLFSDETPTLKAFECVKLTQDVSARLGAAIKALPACPCHSIQAQDDGWYSTAQTGTCFVSIITYPGDLKQKCCYNRLGMLISGSLEAAIPEEMSNSSSSLEQAQTHCCTEAPRLCSWFYNSFSSPTCSATILAAGFGKTNIITFDYNLYTFNGLGDYVLYNTSDVQIQGRTQRNGDMTTTSFIAFAVQFTEGSESIHCQVYLESGKLTWTPTGKAGKFYHINLNSSLIILPTAIFTVTSNGDVLTFTLKQIGSNIKSYGLLGRADKNMTNDFLFRNGTLITGDAERLNGDIINAFAESWHVASEAECLFNYSGAQTFDEANNQTDWKPPVLPTSAERILLLLNESSETAKQICGKELFCLQDYYLNKDNASASTILVETKNIIAEKEKTLAEVPKFINNENTILIGSTHTYKLTLAVGDGMEVEFNSENDFQNISGFALENSTFTWNLSSSLTELRAMSYPRKLEFYAINKDMLSQKFIPTINLCLCEKPSQCAVSGLGKDGKWIASAVIYDVDNNVTVGFTYNNDEYKTGNVNNLLCECENNTGGKYCEVPVDVCLSCYNYSACNDSVEKMCLPCPDGFGGDGKTCRDINECADKNGGCDHICTNTNGSFQCTCNANYIQDGKKCTDIDECKDDPDVCKDLNKYCVNKPGSYDCFCNPNLVGKDKCIKAPYTFIGVAELANVGEQNWSSDLKDKNSKPYKTLAEKIEKAITDALISNSVGTSDNLYTEVLQFSEVPSPSRQKRAAEPSSSHVEALYVIHTSDKSLTPDTIDGALKKATPPGCLTYCPMGDIIMLGKAPSLNMSDNLCNYQQIHKCDVASTRCEQVNQTTYCNCNEGFTHYTDMHSCADINECATNTTILCPDTGNCTNTLGSYECACSVGKVWNKSNKTCVADACASKPCKNSGVCYVSSQNEGFVCRCDYGWSGPYCENKDSDDTERWKVAVICLAVILGALCLILFIILIVICIKQRRTLDSDSYTNMRYSESENLPRVKAIRQPGIEMAENGHNDYGYSRGEMRTSFGYHAPAPHSKSAGNVRGYDNRSYDDDEAGEKL